MSDMECQCKDKEPGWCELFKRIMNGRNREICTEQFVGKPLPAEKCEAYRQGWLENAGKEKKDKDTTCVHRGGEIRKQECQSCAGKVLVKVFECKIWKECQLKRKLLDVRGCALCKDRVSATIQEVSDKG